MIPLLNNKGELKEFLKYCERAVKKTGNTFNDECGPLQRKHFSKIKIPALRQGNTPVAVLFSEIASKGIDLWDFQERNGISDQIADMECRRSIHSELFDTFDTFDKNKLTSTTLWSFSKSPSAGCNQGQGTNICKPKSFPAWDQQWKQCGVDISNVEGITKLTLSY